MKKETGDSHVTATQSGQVAVARLGYIHEHMSRMHRVSPGGVPFHVLNRPVGRRTVLESTADYEGFIEAVAATLRIRRMRIWGYCVMPIEA